MLSPMHCLTRPVRFFARSTLLLILLTLAVTATITPAAEASALAAQDTVGHVVRLNGPAVVHIVSVIQAKLICRGCLASGGDITSPKSGTLTYASSGSGAFITLWTKAANEYDSTGNCHWSLAANDLNALHTRYSQFGAIQPYLAKAQQQVAGETCVAATGSRSSTTRLLVLVGGMLALLVVIGASMLVVVLLARRKQPARMPAAVPTGASYPMQHLQQMTPAAGQGAYPGYPGSYGQPAAPAVPFQPQQQTPPAQPYQQQTPELAPVPSTQAATAEAAPGSPAAPTTPMRRCLNGHIVSEPAAIFCPDCGAGIHLSHP